MKNALFFILFIILTTSIFSQENDSIETYPIDTFSIKNKFEIGISLANMNNLLNNSGNDITLSFKKQLNSNALRVDIYALTQREEQNNSTVLPLNDSTFQSMHITENITKSWGLKFGTEIRRAIGWQTILSFNCLANIAYLEASKRYTLEQFSKISAQNNIISELFYDDIYFYSRGIRYGFSPSISLTHYFSNNIWISSGLLIDGYIDFLKSNTQNHILEINESVNLTIGYKW